MSFRHYTEDHSQHDFDSRKVLKRNADCIVCVKPGIESDGWLPALRL
jgi:hypothetical protein